MPENLKAVDRRLRRTYGISLAEYNEMLEKQGGVCKICHDPPKNSRLHVDHDHKVANQKIKAVKVGSWGVPGCSYGFPTKRDAVALARYILKRKSVRGLVCWFCNAGLKKYRDNPVLLISAGKYLMDYKGEDFKKYVESMVQ